MPTVSLLPAAFPRFSDITSEFEGVEPNITNVVINHRKYTVTGAEVDTPTASKFHFSLQNKSGRQESAYVLEPKHGLVPMMEAAGFSTDVLDKNPELVKAFVSAARLGIEKEAKKRKLEKNERVESSPKKQLKPSSEEVERVRSPSKPSSPRPNTSVSPKKPSSPRPNKHAESPKSPSSPRPNKHAESPKKPSSPRPNKHAESPKKPTSKPESPRTLSVVRPVPTTRVHVRG